MSDDTYTIGTLMDALQALRHQHPAVFRGNTITDVVAELADGSYPAPGDLLNIKAVKFDPMTGKVHLVVEDDVE